MRLCSAILLLNALTGPAAEMLLSGHTGVAQDMADRPGRARHWHRENGNLPEVLR